ncbi:MAG TPA: O-antigen ligase family protein [Devosia sp.]|jgi:O-antigen ligase|uniref:O-antigen ligase family protein n=1 Tax=unclassified Sphingomonas TaxID=196159 RepID=UPI000DBC21C2|nr:MULTISPECIES: O-antigen ligase family protein [unclassified Sphingomonas]PZT90836.1 MAG: hypothetical protein DI625_17080 [Sphingomonas sp.]RSV29530.1 O-antigen ligase domain-containing protein [Sphingomonas sp. ABOLH]HEV7291537.1 O-antigen ligase family protein [Devosia sp.]
MIHARSARLPFFQIDLPLMLSIALILLLGIAGGASRADMIAQVIVRAGCWVILIAAILGGPRPTRSTLHAIKPVLFLLAATIALPLIQLVPLPPSWWQALPGRQILVVPGQPLPWRPWTMTPGATRNALSSLIVPVTILVLMLQASERTYRRIPAILLAMAGTAVVIGLLQFSGAGFDNPLFNDTPGVVSSIFANRNHFALFLSIGCLIAPVWALMDRKALRWRGPLAAGLVILFVLTALATGSRAGILLAGISLVLTLLLVGRQLQRQLSGGPRWLLPALVIAAILVIGGFVALSLVADRADAIKRLMALNPEEDMRTRARPIVVSMIHLYLPFGSGFGGFDPVFRIHEPFALLKMTYFNQAHNDYLGIALDGGIPGLIVLASGILWWLIVSIRIWWAKMDDGMMLGRLGSGIVLLILAASLADYPVRTPTIMAIVTIAAVWMARANAGRFTA